MAGYDTVKYEIRQQIGILTISMPPGNYLPSPEFISRELMDRIGQDESLKGLIVCGEGRNFSAGGDPGTILATAADPELLRRQLEKGSELLHSISHLHIPVIAAINGVCFGGGLEIALACHIRVASQNALLAFPEVNHGLMPGMGGTFRLPSVTVSAAAQLMLLGGDLLTATEALKLGIVDYMAPKGQSFTMAWDLMQKMTHDRTPKLIRYVLRALQNAETLSAEEAFSEELRMFCELAVDEAGKRKESGGS